MEPLKVTLYFIHWNDWFYLPFIKEHYGKFCQRIVMLDNNSSDYSREIGAALGFEVRTFGNKKLNDEEYMKVKNNCWKEERGKGVDYVIVLDCDEFIFLDGLATMDRRWLPAAPIVKGFDMISDSLPFMSITDISFGEPSEGYSKQAIFSPDRINEIDFIHGAHRNRIKPFPGVKLNEVGAQCRLLHYRRIGGVQRMIDRHAQYRPRMSEFNINHGMGFHYGSPQWEKARVDKLNEDKRKEWETGMKNSKHLW